MVHNQIGGAAWLAAPRSYRSTSAFEAIRANLAIPLGMALRTRSKWGCEASNLLCSAIRNNATIGGTWIFGGWRLCPSGRLRAHCSVQIHFFSVVTKTTYRGEGLRTKFATNATLEGAAVFFVLIFLLLDVMLKWLWVRPAGKNHRAVRAPSKKKTKNEVQKTKNLQILLSAICFGAG